MKLIFCLSYHAAANFLRLDCSCWINSTNFPMTFSKSGVHFDNPTTIYSQKAHFIWLMAGIGSNCTWRLGSNVYQSIWSCVFKKCGFRVLGVRRYSLSASLPPSRCCRWWPAWRSRPPSTRGCCRSRWRWRWTGCRCCLCSRHSYTSLPHARHSPRPTRRWNPFHHDPVE